MRLSTFISIHNVTKIHARTYACSGSSLMLDLEAGDWKNGIGEVTIDTGDYVLNERLVKAINEIVAARKLETIRAKTR